ncbi:cadherin-like domain-containing protein [Limnohabitans sp. JirII-29]|uniref:cadherin-like domain-containing protein n=1 Tax=Limnohabitans sp. JirII-29 TaxID=1835756 RepID=UPI001304E2FE|nr:cadherin-like domain-containing protein [Limnohabitans sp. JirII-29]
MTGNFSDSQKQLLTQQLRSVLMQTELSGNTNSLYKFSQAGGQSTYSFGLLQFDLGKNAKTPTEAEVFLKNELGFTSSEITALKGSSIPTPTLAEFNQRLMNNQDKIDAFTDKALSKDITNLDNLISEVAQTRPDVAQSILDNPQLQLRLLDYQNQFGLSGIDDSRVQPDGLMMSYLKGKSVKMVGDAIQLSADGGLKEEDLQNFRGHTLQADLNRPDAERREEYLKKAFRNIGFDSPSGDSIDATLPDGTSVVSTSTTVNGQTTVTAQLLDKDGHVLLSAGAGQTMERDPDTGIVQVRTGTSDQVQQYDPVTGEVSNALRTGSDAAQVYENLLDVFSNPQVPTDKGTQIADASGTLPDTYASTNTNSFTNYLSSHGDQLTTAQQDALAAQINKLGLGTDKALSFYTLPGGGALIATADGNIVGEIVHSSSGDLNLKASAIDAEGNTVQVSQHINEQGSVQTQEQYSQAQLQSVAQGIGLFNGLMNLQQWDQLSDVGKLSALTGAYNAAHAVGAELPGDLGGFASVLGLMQGLDSGNGWMTLQSGLQVGQMGLNAYSSYMSDAAIQMMDDMMAQSTVDAASSAAFDAAAESALESAAASNAMSNAVPYVSIALALNNLEDNPAQSIGTLVGMYFGGPLGGAIGGFIGGALGGLWGDDDPPPPPDGAVHFSWDANGNIQHTIDYNQSGGGDVANNLATGVQSLLEAVVQAINEKNPSSADDVAINPYLIPRIGYSSQTGGAWLEVTMTDGTTFHEPIFSESIAQKLLETLSNNGGLAPAWQVQTLQERVQHLQDTGANDEQIHREVHAGLGGLSSDSSQAFALQGNAAESADFKSQTFGALVLHLGDIPGVQAAQTQLTQVLRDVEGDGYFEQTQAVAATDSAGNLQAVLTIDFNGDGVIQTRDILNLGGNTSEGNPTDAARLANANADLQRNNIEWLDANGDGTIDKSDPAFAAIKLWVDVNQDGVQSGNEVSSLASQHISSINFKTGQVTYADGHTDALTAQTLKADTEGIKFTQIREVNPDGTLRTLDAGTVLEHEGYQGQVQITDEGGTRWVDKREQTYEQQALRTGDWEGTAEQEAHRQGGGNVEGAPTQTTATGTTDFGPVKAAANQTTQSTVAAGDARVVSDAPTQATVKPNAQVTFVAGDSRIKSDAVPTPSPAANSIRVPETRLAFVPSTQASSTNEIRLVTQDMIESAGSSMFGAAGLGVLGAVGLGATASAAEAAAVQANLVSAGSNANPSSSSSANAVSTNNQFTTTLPTSGASSNTSPAPSMPAEVVVKQAEVFSAPVSLMQGVQTVQTAATSTTTSSNASPVFVSSTPVSPVTEAAPVVVVKAVVISSATSSKASSDSTPAASSAPATSTTSTDATSTTSSVSASANAAIGLTLDYPVVIGETLPGTEDVVLRLSQDVLLANDSTPNASADPNAPALTITAVADAVNGQVSLNDGVVVFMPNTNFHGEASFTYTVTDQYGLSTTGSTTLVIAAVNDAPVTQGETGQTQEDTAIYFNVADLLSNDSDVDTATDGQVLNITGIAAAQNGTATLLADGRIRFVPDSNFHGIAQFTYIVNDGNEASNNGSTTATVNVDVSAVNDAPVTQQDTASVDEDTAIVFSQAELLANDSDVDTATDGQVLTITAVSGATNGTVSMLANGDIRFIPSANYHGAANFTYTVSDSNGGTTDASVNLTVLAVNDSPKALGDVFVTQEDSAIVLTSKQLLANDTDNDIATDGEVLTISRVFDALHCTVTLNTDGTINLVPDAQYHGNVRFSYEITDTSGATSTAFVVAGVSAVNDAPVSQSDSFDGTEDTLIILEQADVLANDTDNDVLTDGDSLSVQSVGNASHGTVRLLTSGQIEFLPDANYHGLATFDYVVTDTFGATSTNTVTLSIGAVNDIPVVQGESENTNEDTTLSIDAATLLANDSDVDTATDGQVLSLSAVSSISGKTHGTVSLVTNADGTQTVQFSPDANYHGVASFNYTVSDGNGGYATALATINLAAVNDAPVTVGEIASTDEDTAIFFTQAQLLDNDSDVDTATDGQVLTITAVSGATNGTVSMLANGDIRFIPNANYHGAASFTYTVSDSNGGTTDASVSITVNAVNDIPVVLGESTSTNEDTTLYIAASKLLANDSDVDTITDGQVLSLSSVSSISGQTHGAVSLINNADGTQTVQFTPDANYHGVASFNYTVSDGNGGYATAVATINLAAVNDAPVTVGEISTTDEDTGLTFTQKQLLANDSDVDTATDGQVLTITAVSGATNGTVSMLANGDIRFIPNANYHGTASFTYTVSDGNGGTTDASVSITVNAVNDVPVVTGETVSTNEDTTLWFIPSDLLTNDTDVDMATDGQVLSITAVSNATHGTVGFVTQADGSRRIAFTPDANYFGVASFQYTVSDGAGGTSTGTVSINVAQINDVPVASDDSLSGSAEDNALHISFAKLLSNDTDADSTNALLGGTNDVLTVSAVGNATHGSVALVNGEIVFTPDANYHGVASFVYQVLDQSGALSQATAAFTITAVNDAPVATGETISSSEDSNLLLNQSDLLKNDSDVDAAMDGQVLTIKAVSNARHGSVTLNADGTISFVPDANYYGTASFDYTVDDGNGGTASATATITLLSVNDAPVATGETVQGVEDQQLTILSSALLQNDTDVDNTQASLTISRVLSGAGGTAYLNASGHVVFTPNTNYNGNATFTYWVKDPDGLESNAVTATVVVSAVNDAPTAQGEIVTGASEDAVFYINKSTLLANDSDIDDASSALSLSWVGNASGGSVSLDGNGNVVFTPNANYNGNASFQYKVRDSAGAESAVVQAVIPVAAVNDAPVAADDQFETYKNTTMTVAFSQLTSNDSDVDGDSLTVSAVRDHANGHASIVNGEVQFQATTGFTGAASFDYLSDDGHGGQTWATAYVNVVTPPNRYPVIDWTGSVMEERWPYTFNWCQFYFSINDDGLPAGLSMNLVSVSVQIGGDWYDGSSNMSLNRTGADGYFFYRGYGEGLKTAWHVVDDTGVENICYFGIAEWYSPWFQNYYAYSDHTGYYSPPVILDLNGDGVHFTSLQSSNVTMDVNFDGIQDKMAWAGNDDGVLVWDKDHNHQITDASEFGFQTLKADAQTDLEGLQALDTNGNGLLDAGDDKFAEFAVWQDANGNGKTDANEFKTLSELNIASINLKSDGQMRDAGTLLANSGSGESDAVVMGNAAFTRTDGSTGLVADAMLAYEPGRVAAAEADAQVAEVVRQALLFNQMCNTAPVSDAAALAFVPIETDVTVQDLLATASEASHQTLQAA